MNARHASVPYAKVAAYQRRSTIAFQTLIRPDGPKTDDGFADPPRWVTPAMPAEHVEAAHRVTANPPPPLNGDPDQTQRLGRQLGARTVETSSARAHDRERESLTAEQVNVYVAKHATKSRRYPITLGRLRRPRAPARPPGRPSRTSRPTPGRGRPRSPPARRSRQR